MHVVDSYSGLGFSSVCFGNFILLLLGCCFWDGEEGKLVMTIVVGFFNLILIKDDPLLFFKHF